MRNSTDGGDAILQAFHSLGIDYVMASPGSEWGPFWEAMAQQQLGNEPGPTYLNRRRSSWGDPHAYSFRGIRQLRGRPRH
jgi:hypothetical protein